MTEPVTDSTAEDRFARQTRFTPLGAEGQAALGRARVLIVGCGALGGASAQWLVRAGIGHVTLVDRDIVEVSNLPRQALFSEAHARAGAPKANAAQETLRAAGGPTEIEAHALHLDADVLTELGRDVDLVVDGTDNMRTRYLVNDYCVKRGTPWIYGGVVSGGGLVLAVLPPRGHEGDRTASAGPCLRCVFRDPPPPGTLPTCDTAGVIGPAVGAIASMQAGLALRILGGRDALEPGLIEIDVWSGDVRRLGALRDPNCPACGAREFPFLEDAGASDAVSLCGRNTVQVLPPRGAARPDPAALAAQLEDIGIDAHRVGPLLRFSADGHRFTLFPDGRTLVEGTEDTGRAMALVARFVG